MFHQLLISQLVTIQKENDNVATPCLLPQDWIHVRNSFLVIFLNCLLSMWLWYLSSNGDSVHLQGKVELLSRNAFTSRLLINFGPHWMCKTIDYSGSIKMIRYVWKSCLANGSQKILDGLIFSIPLLPKEILQILLGVLFLNWME